MKYASLNKTSFTSLAAKIIEAMQHVLNTGESVRLKNRKGEGWLLITLDKHKERGYTFAFITAEGQDVGDIILKASVKYWSDEHHALFWGLHGTAWELPEHPLVTVARRDTNEVKALALGATHVIHYWGGLIAYGVYKRNWYGHKVLHIVDYDNGARHKVQPETFPMIRYVEELV